MSSLLLLLKEQGSAAAVGPGERTLGGGGAVTEYLREARFPCHRMPISGATLIQITGRARVTPISALLRPPLSRANQGMRARENGLNTESESKEVLSAERDAYLRQRDEALGERNELQRQRDEALGERNELQRQRDELMGLRDAYLRQRDEAIGECNELRRQLDDAIGVRNELQRQRDEAIGERNEVRRQLDDAIGIRNELQRQRDEVIGLKNQLTDRVARHVHRADMASRRGWPRPMAATRDRILLFLHLAKTGGVTLNEIIVRNLADGDYLVIDMPPRNESALWTWSPAEVDRAIAKKGGEDSGRIRAVLGHYRQGIQCHLPKPCGTITLLRDPTERVLSYFFYDVQRGVRPAAASFDAFVEQAEDLALDNYMTRILSGLLELDPSGADATLETHRRVRDTDYLAARNTLDSCLMVGLTERFDETLLVLASRLGWALCDLVYERRNVSAGRPTNDSIGPATLKKLQDMNLHDVALFSYADTKLAQQIEEYPGDFDRDLALFRRLNTAFRAGARPDELRQMEYEAGRPTTAA